MKIRNYLSIVFLFTVQYCLAQEHRTPIFVNNIVGDTLSYEEGKYYSVFRNFESYNWAVFYLNPDSSLDACINYTKNGNTIDTLLKNYTTLNSMNYNITVKHAMDNPRWGGLTDLDAVDTYNSKPLEQSSEIRKGAGVEIYYNYEGRISGELISVRANSLLILKSGCNGSVRNLYCIEKINFSEIDSLVIMGTSYLGLGIGLGIGAAAIVGASIFAANIPDHSFLAGAVAMDKSLVPILGVSAVLIGVGAAIGAHNSVPDMEINSFKEEDIKQLRAYSRYPIEEPEELKIIE